MQYQPVRNLPVARFYYKGNHSHPVRRTVLIVEADDKTIKGYELRCGSTTRSLENAPVRSFSKDKIATFGSLRLDNKNRKNKSTKTTLTRVAMVDLETAGV